MNKTLKKTIYFLTSFLILLLIGAIIGASYIKPILKDKIDQAIEKSSNGLYKISYNDLKINLITGSAKLSEISIYYDSVMYKKIESIDTIPQLYQIDISILNIKGIHLIKLLKNKLLIINDIYIIEPKIQVWQKSDLKKQAKKNRDLINLKDLESISFKKINIKNGEFTYSSLTQNNYLSVGDFSFKIRNVFLDKNTIQKNENPLFTNEIEAEFYKIILKEKTNFYTLNIRKLTSSLKNKNIEILGLYYTPNYDKNTFAKKKKVQADRLDLSTKSIQISDIDFNQILKENIYLIKRVKLDSLSLEVYRDARIPSDWSNLKAFPYENFFNMTTVLIIDSIEIKNSFINVFQMPESGLKAGNVSFNKVNGYLFKLDNQLKTFNVNANCQFMNTAPLGITLSCFQKDGINNLNTEGILTNLELNRLNSIANATGNVNIEKGRIDKLYYNFYFNGKTSQGNVRFLYKDLKIKILNNEDHSSNLKEKLLSKLGNNLILSDENIVNKDELKGNINYTRDPHFSFYKYYWKTIFSGITDIVLKDNVVTSKIKQKDKAKQKENRKRRN